MKQIIFSIFFLIFFCNCRLAIEPTPQPSASLEQSKEYGVFLNEYQPELPYLRIEQKNYIIKEAWVEHTHRNLTEGIVPGAGYDFVMTFERTQNDSLEFKTFTKDLSLGNSKIWFFLQAEDYVKDTLILNYRDKSDSKIQKRFMLFKKSSSAN